MTSKVEELKSKNGKGLGRPNGFYLAIIVIMLATITFLFTENRLLHGEIDRLKKIKEPTMTIRYSNER